MIKKPKISVVLATFNEETNIGDCLKSVKDIAYEIIIIDGSSFDKTVEIAKSLGAKVIQTDNPPIFHINKQKALEKASGDWILQLDADERVTPELAQEIKKVVRMNPNEVDNFQENLPKRDLFLRNQKQIEERDGEVGTQEGNYVAFFLPRLNFFLGKYLKYGGVYPDGAIRLVKNGFAHFPAKDVHEVMQVNGRVGWLQNDLIHIDSPTFKRYLERNNRYINLIRDELVRDKESKNIQQIIDYFFMKPVYWFFITQLRHKGVLDGYRGVIFSFFSALRFPRAYWRYLQK